MERPDITLADPAAQAVADQLLQQLRTVTVWRYLGRPVLVQFPLANTTYEITHGLAETPDGFQLFDGDCVVTRAPGRQFTKDLAYVRSTVANSFAVLAFGMYRETPLNVQASS